MRRIRSKEAIVLCGGLHCLRQVEGCPLDHAVGLDHFQCLISALGTVQDPPPGKRPAKSGPDKSENPLNSFLVAGRDETLFSASRLVLGRVEQKLLVPSCFDER